MSKHKIIEAVAVTGELTGTQLSEPALDAFVRVLADYPLQPVLKALDQCARELRGRMTLNDVISRIEDGWLTPDRAYAQCIEFNDEGQSVVVCDEMMAAWGEAKPLMDAKDHYAARQAFSSAYLEQVRKAREEKRMPRWWASLGFNQDGRDDANEEAKARNEAQQALLVGPQPKALSHD